MWIHTGADITVGSILDSQNGEFTFLPSYLQRVNLPVTPQRSGSQTLNVFTNLKGGKLRLRTYV